MCPSTAPAFPFPRTDFSLVFPPAPGWVRTAREAVRTALTAAQRSELVDTAVLLTSELVTNAVKASLGARCTSPVTVHAEWAARPKGSLRVMVYDGAPGLPLWHAHTEGAEVGRGLLLMRLCAAEWGVCQHGPGPGKGVWFTLVS
jgi:anti-sigma regulatory factor (Ser/Thr protein kinase)